MFQQFIALLNIKFVENGLENINKELIQIHGAGLNCIKFKLIDTKNYQYSRFIVR